MTFPFSAKVIFVPPAVSTLEREKVPFSEFVATSFTVVTGHEDPTKPESQVHWDYTADTLIILMGIGNIKENIAQIMKYRSADTPVCAIESGTLPNQNLVFGTLGDISDKKINTPAILIIGDVVSMYKDIYNYQGD